MDRITSEVAGRVPVQKQMQPSIARSYRGALDSLGVAYRFRQ